MADISRLSAYDRSIKGHRPDNLAIVARFSPDARPFIGVLRPTVRCPRPDGPSTVASYVLFWSRRHRPLVGLGNVTALQEQKLSTEVRLADV